MGMIALKCPQCGADVQLDETREFGFCTFCGTKVIQDKFVVEHKGSIKLDNSEYVQKCLMNARRAKQKEDWEEAEKYYDLVEQNDPTNIEAIFYSAYSKAKMELINNDVYRREHVLKVLANSISIIDDNYNIDKADEEEIAIKEIARDINLFISSSFVYTQWKNGNGSVVKTDEKATYQMFKNIAISFDESIRNIIQIDNKIYLHKILIDLYRTMIKLSYLDKNYKNKIKNLINYENEILSQLDSNYEFSYEKTKKVREEKNNIVAGILAIVLGFLGIHKFYIGKSKAGTLTLVYSILILPIISILLTQMISNETFGHIVNTLFWIFRIAPWVIEGIIYITKSNDDFNNIYVKGNREWF